MAPFYLGKMENENNNAIAIEFCVYMIELMKLRYTNLVFFI